MDIKQVKRDLEIDIQFILVVKELQKRQYELRCWDIRYKIQQSVDIIELMKERNELDSVWKLIQENAERKVKFLQEVLILCERHRLVP